jgi:hypothetical protein
MSLVDSKIVLDDDADRVNECYSFVDNKGGLYKAGFILYIILVKQI